VVPKSGETGGVREGRRGKSVVGGSWPGAWLGAWLGAWPGTQLARGVGAIYVAKKTPLKIGSKKKKKD